MRDTAERTAVILEGECCPLDALAPALAQGGISIVGDTANPDEIAGLVSRWRPDLLVAESSPNGWGWLRHAREHAPSLRVVVVGRATDPEQIASALRAGATAYVVSGGGEDDIVLAVRQSFERSLYLQPAVPPENASENGVRLTRRETEILTRVAEGQSNGEIARELWLTEQTIKFHLSNVYKKLGVRNRTGASCWAHRHGLVSAA